MNIELDKVFSNKDIKNYNLFIEKLRQLKGNGCITKDILFLIYQYFKGHVTFNYDQLQIEKLLRLEQKESDKTGNNCLEIYKKINKRIATINSVSNQSQIPIKEIIDLGLCDKPYSKARAEELLDDAFRKIEGRGLTDKNKNMIFKDYWDEESLKKNDDIKEIHELSIKQYKPVYYNQMLIDGVSSEYSSFLTKICKDLSIKHMKVEGVKTIEHIGFVHDEKNEIVKIEGNETTQHSWIMIYLPEEQRWVHFDMTMVKYYQDGWIKEHEPYNMEDWIAASTSDIFKMQPTRKITKINGINCLYNKDNYINIDISKYDKDEERE